MTSAANIAAGFTGIAPPIPAATSAVSPTSSVASSPLSKPDSAPVSPQFKYDPSAGLIIQYLNSGGQVEVQIPSATVVAYLRAGLTAQGFPQQNTQA